jgi:hypothetical protein
MHSRCYRGWTIFAALLAVTVLHARDARADVNFFRLFKTESYQQTSNAQPSTIVGTAGNANILYSDPADFTAAQVDSTSPLSPMTLSANGPGVFDFGQAYPTVGDLDTNFPDNTIYAFSIAGGNLGPDAAALNTPATSIYAAQVPYFNGTVYDQLQGMDSTAPFNFTLDGYDAPAGSNTALTFFALIRVSDGALIYSDVGANSQTVFSVPGGVLDPGTAYYADLDYSSRIDTPNAGFGGATAEVGYDLRTDLYFTTAVPEPGTFILAGLGGLALLAWRRR